MPDATLTPEQVHTLAAAFVRDLATACAADNGPRLRRKSATWADDPSHHAPSGPHGGQFTSSGGGDAAAKPEPAKPAPAPAALPDRNFGSLKEANAWGAANVQTEGGVSEEEAAGIQHYRRNGYQQINGQLRGTLPAYIQGTPGDRKKATKAMWALDAAMHRSRTQKSVQVTRGLKLTPEIAAQLKPGATFTDKGFTSTTLTPERTAGFQPIINGAYDYANAALLTIDVPKGTRALYLKERHEAELLLDRSTQYEVVSAERDKDGRLQVALKVKQQHGAKQGEFAGGGAHTKAMPDKAVEEEPEQPPDDDKPDADYFTWQPGDLDFGDDEDRERKPESRLRRKSLDGNASPAMSATDQTTGGAFVPPPSAPRKQRRRLRWRRPAVELAEGMHTKASTWKEQPRVPAGSPKGGEWGSLGGAGGSSHSVRTDANGRIDGGNVPAHWHGQKPEDVAEEASRTTPQGEPHPYKESGEGAKEGSQSPTLAAHPASREDQGQSQERR